MLCQYCEDFDYDRLIEDPGYEHQPNWQALELSAERGCDVCRLVSSESFSYDSCDIENGYYSDESTKQVYCTLDPGARGLMFWNFGNIHKAILSVCVECEFWL